MEVMKLRDKPSENVIDKRQSGTISDLLDALGLGSGQPYPYNEGYRRVGDTYVKDNPFDYSGSQMSLDAGYNDIYRRPR